MIKRIIMALAFISGCSQATNAQTKQDDSKLHEFAVSTNSIWSNWYIQAGLDMTLQNPCYHDFSEVFPKGKTFGIHAAIGKQFTPGLSARMKVMWDNGIIENKHLEWVAPFGKNGVNFDKGGIMAIYGEVHLCFTNLLLGYDETRRWDIEAYPRMGLVSNKATESGSPVIGVGVINTYKISDKLSLYFDMAYNMTTSEFVGNDGPWSGGGVNGNANGYFDLNIGVQYNLGNNKFKRLVEH